MRQTYTTVFTVLATALLILVCVIFALGQGDGRRKHEGLVSMSLRRPETLAVGGFGCRAYERSMSKPQNLRVPSL
jgi:hypothetical protein